MKRLAAGLLMLAAGAATARAADGAAFDVIGYSKDGRYFAFEQYGIQDGSGFPYWEIYAIDLEADAFTAGSPVRVRIDREDASLADARAEATKKAEPALKPLKLDVPAQLIAANFTTELQRDRGSIRFARYYPSQSAVPENLADYSLPVHEISLTAKEMAAKDLGAGAKCPEGDGPYLGFSLTLTDLKLKQSHAVHKDETVPASRGCPVAYAVTAIAGSMGAPDSDRLVAIISVYTRGFEGLDERFIAVPFSLSD